MVMEKVFLFLSNHRVFGVTLVVVLSILAYYGIEKIQINVSTSYFMKSNKIEFNRKTEKGERVLDLIKINSKAASIYNKKYIYKIRQLVAELKKIPNVHKVVAITNVKTLEKKDGVLKKVSLIGAASLDSNDIDIIKKRLASNANMKKTLVGADEKSSIISVEHDIGLPSFTKIKQVVDKYKSDFHGITHIGIGQIHYTTYHEMVMSFIMKATLFGFILMCFVYIVFLKRISASVPLLLISGINLLFSYGLFGYLSLTINLMSSLLLLFIIVLGSTQLAHLVCSYLKAYARKNECKAAIAEMVKKGAKPLILSSATTAISFFGFCFSSMQGFIDYGLCAGLAILICCFNNLFVLPLIITFFPMRGRKIDDQSNQEVNSVARKVIYKVMAYINKHTNVLFSLIIILFVSALFISSFSERNISWYNAFSAKHKVTKDMAGFVNSYGGMATINVMIKVPNMDFFQQASNLQVLKKLTDALQSNKSITMAYSIADVYAQLNKTLSSAQYKTPGDQSSIDELSTYISTDDTDLVNYDYDTATIKVRYIDTSKKDYQLLKKFINEKVNQYLPGATSISYTGIPVMLYMKGDKISKELIMSLLVSIFIVFILFCFEYSSIVAGVLALVSNIMPLLLTIVFMRIFNIYLNMFSLSMLLVVFGVGVDDTIHFFNKFGSFSLVKSTALEAVTETIFYELKPVVVTTVAIMMGFLVMLFCPYKSFSQCSLVLIMGIFFAGLCDLVVNAIVLLKFRVICLVDIIAFQFDQNILKDSPIFNGLSTREIKQAVLYSHVKHLVRGEQLIEKGGAGRSMYIVAAGQLKVVLEDNTILLNESEVVGEIGYFSNKKRTTDVYATEDSAVIVFNEGELNRSLRFKKSLLIKISKNIFTLVLERLTAKV